MMESSNLTKAQKPLTISTFQRLKSQISKAQEYSALEKCMEKIQKLKAKIQIIDERKIKKQFTSLLTDCEFLVKEKTKYLKKKILVKFSSKEDQQRTLKYSKSEQNFDKFIQKSLSTQKRKKQRQLDDLSKEDAKTKINECQNEKKKDKLIAELEEELNFLRKQRIQNDQFKRNTRAITTEQFNLMNNFTNTNNFSEQYHAKMRQKGLEIQELKGKLKYYQQKNTELKNRLLNQQRRQDDYIFQLKKHIEQLNLETNQLQRENIKLVEELQIFGKEKQYLSSELKRSINQICQLNKSKKQMQKEQINQLKSGAIKKQLEQLALHQKYIIEVENLLEKEKQQQNYQHQKNILLEKQIQELQAFNSQLEQKLQKIAEINEAKEQEIRCCKLELSKVVKAYQEDEQILKSKDRISIQEERKKYEEKQKKQLEIRLKLQKLKQVKAILQENL